MLAKAKRYTPLMQPRDYQVRALVAMAGRKAFALLMAMRTGKTKVLLDDFGRLELAGLCDDLLVIAPAGVYHTWATAITDHVSIDLQSRLTVATWVSGPRASAKVDGFLHMLGGPRIFLVNVEALSTASTGARAACELFLSTRQCMIAVDESTIIKSPKAIRTKYINNNLARYADYRRILSGLPTPRSPLDLYTQFEFLDRRILNFTSYWTFRMRYAVIQEKRFGGRKAIKIVVAYKNQEELQRKIEPHSFRVEFRPDIPSTYSIREVTLSKEQIRVYNELKTFATAQLAAESHVTATIVIAQIMRLHQVLMGHTVDEAGVEHILPEHRTKELLELLDDYAGKAIIWCSYDYDVRKLTDALEKEYGAGSVARFWGGNTRTREAEEQAFKTDPQCRFMLATPSAGGRGRTWDVADLVVYYSSTNNLEHRDQSEQRAQNVNKTRQVDYVDLIAPGTVETKILAALRAKIDMAALITGDSWRQWVV